MRLINTIILLPIFFSCGIYAQKNVKKTLTIQEQGSFAIGGTITTDENGNQFHGDHGYVFYQKPTHPHKYPLVFLHGIYQSSKTWESTPDGREGFQNIFIRHNFSTYNLTHPRRGNAGRGQTGINIQPIYDEQTWYTKWRIGIYPNYFKNVQFPHDQESLNQFMRQITPDTGPIDFDVNTDAIAALFDKLEGAIMMAHSQGVMHTWKTMTKTKNIKAVIALEGGGFFSFPTDEPHPITEASKEIEYIMVSPDTFKVFTQTPILLIYGDNIPTEHSNIPELDIWRIRLDLAYQWANTVNKHGGNVTIIHLPKIGIYGNTHFPMSDLNNIDIANVILEWLHEQKLD
ncbi:MULTISPECIES: alpha/beta fold hydrolase [Bacteroides]|jgi:pimeloyl-ACP methyl ester carboxylesterase|uniref:alpha/beta hydrolase n=1 Tax=Bacteroides TaxID=816 RepID=UPI000E42EFFA|nr:MULTISPECIES: alpha/beta fold hydrolase [Bacteroides]MBS7575395.1 alpha/beta fold hydrolase [Bacteroides propionicigenes]RGM30177.1 alpha/beta hydrolase [Bacteroides sp. OM08-17BH]HBO06187.1 alpha/beta hydrolase [Bacteroides sp.]